MSYTSSACLKYPGFNPFFLRGGGMPDVRKFFADFRFQADPALPPQVDVVYSNLHPAAQAFFVQHLEAVRWTCTEPPVDTQTRFEWSSVSGPPGGQLRQTKFGEAQVTLSRFLALMKEVPEERVSFNLDEMGCPFVVRWTTFRPAAANRARPLSGKPDPRQAALLQWLASLEVDVADALRDKLIGESMDIKIPCGRINLAPPSATAASSAG
ncbi:hypothetical protein ACS5PN_16950 [Roseateles sp. NT4]|uniref:hypothetical protein n=1 Tax=Roseateles sp. NT4 TaxID=3453715 RepID=UPI003EEEBA74